MNIHKSVGIIGGGLAGIATSVFLKENGFNVSLFEASPKLGGRTYSLLDRDSGEYIDNGQHILAGWYENTFELLEILGTLDLINFHKTLEINYFDITKNNYVLKCPDLPAPFNILAGLLNFKGFNAKDCMSLLKLSKLWKFNRNYIKFKSAAQILADLKQTDNVIKYFWNPFIYAVFNANPVNVSPEIFLNVISKGFRTKKSSVLSIPECDLNALFVNPSLKYFEKNKIEINTNSRVDNIKIEDGDAKYLLLDNGKEYVFDYYVSAAPFFSFNKLFAFNDFNKYFVNTDNLRASTIISVHVFLENDISDILKDLNFRDMNGLIGTTVQWVFKKSERHLSLVISGADEMENKISDKVNDEIFNICIDDLKKCFDGFDNIKISNFKVIKEKRATFIPDKESLKYRISAVCGINNLFISGDWTDTGLPATIESSVLSAKKCTQAILKTDTKNKK